MSLPERPPLRQRKYWPKCVGLVRRRRAKAANRDVLPRGAVSQLQRKHPHPFPQRYRRSSKDARREPPRPAACCGLTVQVHRPFAQLRLLHSGKRYRFENQHSCDPVPILFLFGRVHAMRSNINSETVHTTLHRHVGQFAEAVRVVLLKHGDRPARTADVYASEAGIELHNIRTGGHLHRSNDLMGVEIEDGESVVSLAGEEGAMVLYVKRHSVVAFAPFDWIAPHHLVGHWIDGSKLVAILQVHVDQVGRRITPVSLSKCSVVRTLSLRTSTT